MKNVDFSGISLFQMQICVTVAQYKSITKAAAELHASQPALSKKITQIEEQLGFFLFIRGKNTGLRPTPAGQFLISYWERLLIEFRTNMSSAAKIQECKSKRIILVTTPSAEKSIFISPVVSELRRSYPSIELRVENYGINDAKEMLEAGIIDVVLVNSFHSDLFDKDCFNWQMVLSCPWSVGMLRSNPLAKKKTLTFEDLKTQQFILPQSNSFIEKMSEMCKSYGFSPSVSYYARNFYGISLCICGNDEVYITDRFLQDYYNKDCVCFDLPDTRSGVMMAVRKHEDNPNVEIFRQTALKIFESLKVKGL